VSLRRLGAPHIAEWRDRRLQSVSAASVRREWNLLSNVCAIAVREWRLLQSNPFKDLARPKSSQPRNRVATDAEIETLTENASPNMRRVILFAIETGMRAGEIASLRPEDIRGAVATLNDTKNGTSREVPLSAEARALLSNSDPVFQLTAESISALFAQLCKRCEIEGLTFHDLRHLAATRLSRKLNTLQLCRMFGWKDTKHVFVYYNETAAEVAEKL
jgi:integrase